jgi:hypothetical protein
MPGGNIMTMPGEALRDRSRGSIKKIPIKLNESDGISNRN